MNNNYQNYRRLYENGRLDKVRYAELSLSEYYNDPRSFTEEQAEQFYQFAKEHKIPFEKDENAQQHALIGAMNQLASGVVEGFTTFGWADDPDTKTEKILNKAGHLIGFAPDIIAGWLTWGASLPGSAAKKSAFRAARIAAGKKVQKGLGEFGEKYIPALTRVDKAGNIQLRSVPMRAADWVIEQGKNRLGGAEFLRTNFIGKRLAKHPELLEIMEEGAHLGMAMAFSARKDGPDGWADSAQHGAMAGIFFGSVRNYVHLGTMLASRNPKTVSMAKSEIKKRVRENFVGPRQPNKVEKVTTTHRGIDYDRAQYIDFITRGTLGSAFTGGMTTMQNAPMEDQLYEYALGFFFGSAGRPKFEARATKAIVENMVGQKGEPDKILTVVQKGDSMIINGADIKKMQWYKDLGKKEKRYIDAFTADLVVDQINSMGSGTSDLVLRTIRNKLNEMGDIGAEKLTQRQKIQIYLEASKEAKKEILIKNKELIEAKQKDLAERPDIDVKNVKEGDFIDLYNIEGRTESVEVAEVRDSSIGRKVWVKGSGGKKVLVDSAEYFTKNLFSPDFKIPTSKIWSIPKKYQGKRLSELTNEEKTELQDLLQLEIKKLVMKKNVIPEDIDNIVRAQKAIKIDAIRGNPKKTDSERAFIDNEINPDKLKKQEPKENEIEKDSQREDPDMTVRVNKARELLDKISEDVPSLNPVETRKIMKMLAKKSANYQEFQDAVVEFLKRKKNELPAEEFDRLKKYFVKGKDTSPMRKVYFQYSGAKERQSVTLQKTMDGNAIDYLMIETPATDGFNNPLLLSREETYYNKAYEKGDKPLDVTIQYIKTERGYNKIGNALGQSRPFFNKNEAMKDMFNASKIYRDEGRYFHHINPSNNELKMRRFIVDTDPTKDTYWPEMDKAIKWAMKSEIRKDAYEKFNKVLHDTHTHKEMAKEYINNWTYELRDAGLLPMKTKADWTFNEFKRAVSFYKSNPSFENIIKWTQYRKVVENGRDLSFDTKKYGPDGIKAVIINDANGVFGISDGQKYYSKRLRKDILNEAGRDLKEGYIKDVIVTDPVYNSDFSKARGMVFNKSAEQATHEGVYQLMKDLGVDIAIVKTGSKANSRHKEAQVEYDPKQDKYVIKDAGELFNVQSRDIKMIKSEAEVRDTKIQRLPFQAIMQRYTMFGPEFNKAMTTLFENQFKGKDGYTTKLLDIVNTVGPMPERILIEGRPIDIDNVNLYTLIDVFNRQIDTPLGMELLRSLYEKDVSIKESFEKTTDLDASLRTTQDLLKQFNYDPIVLRLGNNHKYVEQTLRNYINTRVSRPRVDYGNTYVRMKAADPMLLSKINLTDSNFYLTRDHKNDPVNIQKPNGKDYTLQEALTELQEYRARKNPTNTDKNRIKQLEDALNYVIVRSPVGNPSGVLSLDFAGFVDVPGKGIIMSKKNVERAGGADFDGDAVGMYQSLPGVIKKTFKNPKIVDMLKTDLTKPREDLGFERKETSNKGINAMNIMNPRTRADQAAEVVNVSKMIGSTSNLMQFVREHLNYLSQNPLERVRLNTQGDSYLVPKRNIDGVEFKNVNEIIEFFESYDAPNILNLVLDGAKNSKNPTMTDLQNMVFDRYFEVITPIEGIVPTAFSFTRKAQLPSYSAMHKQRNTEQVFDVKSLFESIKSQESWYKTEEGRGNHIFENKKVQIIRKGTEAKEFDDLTKRMKELLEIKEEIGGDREIDNQIFILKQERDALGVREGGTDKKPVWRNHDKKTLDFDYDPAETRQSIDFKDIQYVIPELDLFSAFSARRNFQNALKRGLGEGGEKTDVGNISEIAERYIDEYTINFERGDRYSDSIINIAEQFGKGDFFDKIHFNVKPLNDATFPNFTMNILKALKKTRNSPILGYLRKQGIINEEILAFTDNINSKLFNKLHLPVSELTELFDVYSDVLNKNNLVKGLLYNPGYLPEQVMNIVGLLNFEVNANRAFEYFKKDSRFADKRFEKAVNEKFAEVIDVAYKIRLADLIKQKYWESNIHQEFDLDTAVREYRTQELGVLRVPKELDPSGMIEMNAAERSILSEMFSTALLSNVFSNRKNLVSYFNRIKGRDETFLNDYGIDLTMTRTEKLDSFLDQLVSTAIGKTKIKDHRKTDITEVDRDKTKEWVFEEGYFNRRFIDLSEALKHRSIQDINPDHIFRFLEHSRRIQVLRPNMIKSDSIPLEHKKIFFEGMKDIIVKGEIINNNDRVLIDTSHIKSKIGKITTSAPSERYGDEIKIRTIDESIKKPEIDIDSAIKDTKITEKEALEQFKKTDKYKVLKEDISKLEKDSLNLKKKIKSEKEIWEAFAEISRDKYDKDKYDKILSDNIRWERQKEEIDFQIWEKKDKIKKEVQRIQSKPERDKLKKDFVIARDEKHADYLENILKMSETDIALTAKKIVQEEFDKMSDKEKYEYLEEGSTPIEMKSLGERIVKNRILTTDAVEYELSKLRDVIEKNPDVAVSIEGDFVMFSKMVGLEGLPQIGKTFGRMNLSDLRFFNNYVKDVYLSGNSFIGKLKKYASMIGKNVFDNKFWSNKENVPKSPIKKMYHLYLQQLDTMGAGKDLRAKEMLQVYQENIPVLDKIDGEYVLTKKSLTMPMSTLEIVRQQVEFGNTFASTMQDYFEDIISDSFDIFNTKDRRLQAEKDVLIEAAVNQRLYDGGMYGGLRLNDATKLDFYDSFQRSEIELQRMKEEHKEFRILDETSGKGNERKVSPQEAVEIINNRITDVYDVIVKDIYQTGVETVVKNGVRTQRLTENAKKRVLTNGFLDVNKVNKLMKDMKMGNESKVDLMQNLIGYNEFLYYKYEYELIKTIQNLKNDKGELVYPNFDPKKPETITSKVEQEAKRIRAEQKPEFVQLQLDKNGRPSNYWSFTNHHQFGTNKKNIDNHIQKLVVEKMKRVRDWGEDQLPPHYKALYKIKAEGYETLDIVKDRIIADYKDGLLISMQRVRSANAGMGDSMTQLVGSHRNKVVGAFMAGHQKSKGEDPIPGFGKDLNVLSSYVKAMSKSYIDTAVGLRSTMLIDNFKKTNALKDEFATEAWTGYMRESLGNMLGMSSMRNIEYAGVTKSEHKLLKAYIDANLDFRKIQNKVGNNYRKRNFIKQIDDLIAPDSYWYARYGDKLSEGKLRQALQDYRMKEAKKLADVKNINKINRFGTIYHLTSDAAAVNAIRTLETRIGQVLGKKEGEFSFFGDLRFQKDPITGEMKKVSEDARRISLARKLKKIADFEGKWELLSLLSHPKTAITNVLGGSQNIYADTGWQPFRQATDEGYLINTVFKGAKYKTKNPRTGEVIEKSFESFRDIETWLSQEGFLEGMYIEQAGINKTFRDADMNKAATEIIKKLFTPKNKELLDSNPTEFDKIRRATIIEIGNKYGVFDAITKWGATFMSATEIKLRRTAALAHYLNARDVMMPLTSEMPYNSPMLMEIARKGIESSQFIYHSAFRSNYSNTSLGRVMTRFHPYAWNSVKRRRLLWKGAKYTEWSQTTNSSKVFQRQLTADLMSFALASMFTSTLFEYSLSPPMSWLQDTSQWLFGDEKERERAFFSQWPTTAVAPLQIVTPPIARYILPPINAVASGDFDSFVKFHLATYAPFGRLGRDIYRAYKSPQMTVDLITGVPIHRMGQHITKQREAWNTEKEIQENIAEFE